MKRIDLAGHIVLLDGVPTLWSISENWNEDQPLLKEWLAQWSVWKTGSQLPYGYFDSKEDAIKFVEDFTDDELKG